MKSLLIHRHTFERIADRLAAFEGRLSVVTMDLQGAFREEGSGAMVEKPVPDIAFGNLDVWSNPKAKRFLGAIMDAPCFEWFQSSAAGIEFPALREIGRKARFYTTCHVQAEAMAEWALWTALDFLRAGAEHRAQQASQTWTRLDSREISGSRWLIVGFGSIGAAIGRRVKALGGYVTGVRRSGGDSADAHQVATTVRHDDLAAADIVVLCAPHTPETEDMADARFFATMKPEAGFLNLGRGALVNEADLIAALDAGCPAFAALDVVRTEPLPAGHPLWAHSKVLITPHNSGQTRGTVLRTDELFLENLALFLSDRPMKCLAAPSAFAR